MLIKPKDTCTETIAQFFVEGKTVFVKFAERNDIYRDVIKSLNYYWDERSWRWMREYRSAMDGNISDRVAETAHHLLNVGIAVDVPADDIAKLIVTGSYTPEVARRVYKNVSDGDYKEWFLLWWRRTEDMYEEARKLPNSRYLKPYVAVPPERYNELLDFSEVHGFTISKSAQEIIDEQEQKNRNAILFDAKPLPIVDKIMRTDDTADYKIANEFLDDEL